MKKLLFLLITVMATQASAKTTYGDWIYFEEVDPITDQKIGVAATLKNNGRGLAVRRDENGVFVGFGWNKFFAGDQDGDVIIIYRVDKRKSSKNQYWRLFGGERNIAMAGSRLARDFIQVARQGQTITIRVIDPIDGETITEQFSLRGMELALRRMGL